MGKEKFASLVIAKLKTAVGTDGSKYNDDTPVKAQKAIAEAITEYLTANTTVTISYSGTLNSGGGADPIVTDTLKITGQCGTIGKPLGFDPWVQELQSVIASSFSVMSPGTDGVVVSFNPFNPTEKALQVSRKGLRDIYQNNISDPIQATWGFFCGKLLDWLNSEAGKNPSATSITANRTGISTGVASLTKITVL